jgi:hypothetical protein
VAAWHILHDETLRTRVMTPLVRFEGLAGEFPQHDFGEVDVRYQDGTAQRVHFFASHLKYSRGWRYHSSRDEKVETLVRALVDHLSLRASDSSESRDGPQGREEKPEFIRL